MYVRMYVLTELEILKSSVLSHSVKGGRCVIDNETP